jgi:hypothetical protein
MDDRYASVRPDVDGMSFLSCMMSAVDAAAIDRILSSLAAAASPGDLRTMRQRRSDALVDMLCGRISNGCHVVWDANDDSDDHLDNTDDHLDNTGRDDPAATHAATAPSDPSSADSAPQTPAPVAAGNQPAPVPADDQPGSAQQLGDNHLTDGISGDGVSADVSPGDEDEQVQIPARPSPHGEHPDGDEEKDFHCDETDWDAGDWELPAAAFRADPPWSGSADPPEPRGRSLIRAAPGTAPGGSRRVRVGMKSGRRRW